LSVHSGSDKFSIYEPMRRGAQEVDAGVHIKTAGTTCWKSSLASRKRAVTGWRSQGIYALRDGIMWTSSGAPYASVIDIDNRKLAQRRPS